MRVGVLGGTGVFGVRLAEMLVRDGHAVVLLARGEARLRAEAARIGAGWRAVDRAGALDWVSRFDAVIDASGPFQAYGAAPYRLAGACLAAGVVYLDLADDAGFCAGLAALGGDGAAWSGVSSVPGLSSIVARALAEGMDQMAAIETAILPGNRAPRGRAVIESILGAAGAPFEATEGGRPAPRRGWSDPARIALPGLGPRRAFEIEVPDQRLFPAHFGAGTVRFRAGLEMGVMAWGLRAIAALRPLIGAPRSWLLGALTRAAEVLKPFGTDTGAMVVEVTGGGPGAWVRRRWVLVVRAGQGPYVPGVLARALLRRAEVPRGVGPALGLIPLEEAEAAMADLATEVTRTEARVVPLFQAVLGETFARLPAAVQASHQTVAPLVLEGRGRVTRGRGPWPRLLAALFRFPQQAEDVPVTVIKRPTARGETWERRFGPRVFRSHLAREGARMTERFGPFTFTLGLTAGPEGLAFPVRAGRLGGLPLPRWLLPGSEAWETETDGRFRFDVRLTAPITGALMVHYEGWLKPV